MTRIPIGEIWFTDGRLNAISEITVTVEPSLGQIYVSLVLDAKGRGLIGAGECDVGFSRAGISELLSALERATQIARTEKKEWHMSGKVRYSWCDRDDFKDTGGSLLVEGRHGDVRLIVRLDPRNEMEDYVATLDLGASEKLASILKTV